MVVVYRDKQGKCTPFPEMFAAKHYSEECREYMAVLEQRLEDKKVVFVTKPTGTFMWCKQNDMYFPTLYFRYPEHIKSPALYLLAVAACKNS